MIFSELRKPNELRARQPSIALHHLASAAASGLVRARAPQPDHILQHMRAVADDAEIDFDVLVDRGWVDIDVDLPRLRREGVEAPGDAIVEARADADHQIAIMHRVLASMMLSISMLASSELGEYHLVMSLARWDHWEAIFFLIDEAVEDDGLRRVDHLDDAASRSAG